jgi:hypothetical protein
MFTKLELLELAKVLDEEYLNNKFQERENVGKFFHSRELLEEIEKDIVKAQELHKLIDELIEYFEIEPYIEKKII